MTTVMASPSAPSRQSDQQAFRVEVAGKPGVSDAAGAAVKAQLQHLGVASVTDVRVAKIYELRGSVTASQVNEIAQQLLADPIIQDFQVSGSRSPAARPAAWRIEVWLKPTVSDPVGESVRRAIGDLGMPQPEAVRCGTSFSFFGRLNGGQAEKIALKLLANPIVHRYSVTPPQGA